MKRELLLEKIEEYKSLMPWFVLEYYQSKLSVPYSFTTLYEYLKEYKRFFDWLIDSGLSLIHISEPTRHYPLSRMPSAA